jgi:hypothetical protein
MHDATGYISKGVSIGIGSAPTVYEILKNEIHSAGLDG